MAASRRNQLLTVGLVAIGAVIVITILLSNSSSLPIGGTGLLILLIALRVIPDLFDNYSRKKGKTIRRADRGADAEEDIGKLLEQLGDDFVVLHDIESPYGNIDHVVISQKSGITLLETKSHRGKVTTTESNILVNGKKPEKDFVAQALKNSYWLRDETERVLQIKPWITPVVVFTNGFVEPGRPVKGVRAMNKKFLLQMLQTGRADSANAAIIWTNREKLADDLTGVIHSPAQKEILREKPCPKCGKKMVEKIAKGGPQVAGKRFWVCPDYPQCKTAFPVEKEEDRARNGLQQT